MPKLELHYFPFKGRGEAIRLALHIGGIPFEDVRVPFEDFFEKKAAKTYIYDQVPALFIDGAQYTQSNALARYCGQLSGLVPSSLLDVLTVDEYLCALDEIWVKLPYKMSVSEEELPKARKQYVESVLVRILSGMERAVLERSEESSIWLVGDSITFVDLLLYATLGFFRNVVLDHVPTNITDDYPRLMRTWHAVDEHPKVVEWNKIHADVIYGNLS